MKQPLTIGLTDGSKYANYERWMESEGARVIKLGYAQDNFDALSQCHGVIMTGGHDVDPQFYGHADYATYCHEVDPKRDEFELNVMGYTEKNGIPVLGICRGLQLVNVYFGGTLIPDMTAFGKPEHAAFANGDRYHGVLATPGADLAGRLHQTQGEINSAHHQAVDRPAEGLVVNALSMDGVVEGMERAAPEGKGYLLLVQWHPERMNDQQSPFVSQVKSSFLEAARARMA